MNKDELKKEAEEWVKDHSGLIGSYEYVKYDYDSLIQAYLASAEPREKQIAELKEQIEKMKCCGNCSHFKLDNSALYPIYACELTYPNRCKNHNKWEIKEK